MKEYYIICLFIACVFFSIAIILAVLYNTILGIAGERYVKGLLKKLNKEKYLVINDLMIRTLDGRTHQIDHVVVSVFGIFVIETKQYNGYIVGAEYDRQWKLNNKIFIQNPLIQNYYHIKALMEVLNIDEKNFINLVCIPSRAKVKVNSQKVTRYYSLLETITRNNVEYLNNYKEIYNYLININIVDKKERKKHIEYAKDIKNKSEIENITKCPKCGGSLVVRNGKYGNFIGCSNYPKCRYTENNYK